MSSKSLMVFFRETGPLASPAKQDSCWGPIERTAWLDLATEIFPTVTHWSHGSGWYSSTCQAKKLEYKRCSRVQSSPPIWGRTHHDHCWVSSFQKLSTPSHYSRVVARRWRKSKLMLREEESPQKRGFSTEIHLYSYLQQQQKPGKVLSWIRIKSHPSRKSGTGVLNSKVWQLRKLLYKAVGVVPGNIGSSILWRPWWLWWKPLFEMWSLYMDEISQGVQSLILMS